MFVIEQFINYLPVFFLIHSTDLILNLISYNYL